MISQSIQQKLSRVRKPRVHITYDVETEGAVIQKELPFVVGVVGDFSGASAKDLPPLKDRKFVQVDRDNFNEVLGRMRPAVSLQVPNLLDPGPDAAPIKAVLTFSSMEDFEPGRVAERVEPIARLLKIRHGLQELLTKADRSPELEELLEQIVQSDSMRKELEDEMKGASETKGESQPALPGEAK